EPTAQKFAKRFSGPKREEPSLLPVILTKYFSFQFTPSRVKTALYLYFKYVLSRTLTASAAAKLPINDSEGYPRPEILMFSVSSCWKVKPNSPSNFAFPTLELNVNCGSTIQVLRFVCPNDELCGMFSLFSGG